MLSLSDAELSIIIDLAAALEPAQRDPFLKSVAVVLCQCTTRGRGHVYRLALEEQKRFLEPQPRRSQRSARFNGHA
jgi:hypothetical protein